MNFRTSASFSALLALSALAHASRLPTSFDGYITNIESANEFDVGSRHVICDAHTTRSLAFTNPDQTQTFDVGLHVGSRIRVDGAFRKPTGTFVARSIEALPVVGDKQQPGAKIAGEGLIQEAPELHRDGKNWSGTLWIDGYLLHVTPKTEILADDGSVFPADKVGTNLWASYESVRQTDRTLEVTSMTLSPNRIDANEVKFRDKYEPGIVLPNYAKHTPGAVKSKLAWTLDILPDKTIQDYVTSVGNRLVPQFQRDLPASDPAKINFRFYVIQRPSKWKETFKDAGATPGGLILVPDNVLAALDNEAQLAAILSNCIAATLEKQIYAHRARIETQKVIGWAGTGVGLFGGVAGLADAPLQIGDSIAAHNLMLQMNEKASRIGLRYMIQNGYDIREAPYTWTVAANHRVENPQAKYDIPEPLVQSLMNDVRLNYDGTNFGSLKTDRDPYQQMLTQLRSAAPKLPKPKNDS
jgi:hypothetical protein